MRVWLFTLAMVWSAAAQAATLVHDVTFDDGLNPAVGRLEVTGTGTVADGTYRATAESPLRMWGFDNDSQYTLVIDATYDAFADGFTFNEVLGQDTRGGSEGVFFSNGRLATFKSGGRGGSSEPLQIGADAITLDKAFQLVLTVDRAADVMTGYLDGVRQWEAGVLDVLQRLDGLTLFANNTYPRQSPGYVASLDRFRYFDGALGQVEVSALVAPVPVPGALMLMIGGLGGLAGLQRRR